MVLSFLRTMPPSIEESMAFMAKNLAKLIAVNALHNEQQAALNAKLKLLNEELATGNERLSSLIRNTVKPDQTVTPFYTASSSSIAKIENNVTSKSRTPHSVLPALPTKLIHNVPTVQNEIVIFQPTKLYQPCVLATLVKDMLGIFRGVKTFFIGHQSHPPKIVFLQSEPEPPWKPRETCTKS